MPHNEFSRCSQTITETDLQAVEARFQVRIPTELRAHYLECNGGRPERKCWPDEGEDPTCLKQLIPIRPSGLPEDAFGKANTMQDALAVLFDGPHMPRELLPFAEDWGGNYFCVDQDTGAIYWFAMDIGDDFVRARRYLSGSFTEFLAGLVDEEEE